MADPVVEVERTAWRDGKLSLGTRAIPEEAAVAITYNGGTYAVMMATPQDFEDFAVGFSLTEGVVGSRGDIERFEVVEEDVGIELRLWLREPLAGALAARRRRQAGPTGCGLCGIESLTEALRCAPAVERGRIYTPDEIANAAAALAPLQSLNQQTRAVHAAAFWRAEDGIVAVREDVGRHNALDKLCGALARNEVAAGSGVLVMTSRVSVELVQKAAVAGFPVLAAVSAPTALAVRTAEAAGITLIGVARSDGFEVFTHPDRVQAAGD